MSNRTTLKSYFITNAIPKQSDFADLIDSSLVQSEDSIRKQGSDPVAVQAQQADQNGIQQVLHFYKNFNDANAAWKFSLLTQGTTNPVSGLNIGNPATAQSCLFIKESDGSIGVGTNNPMAKLHISGNAVIDGKLGIGITSPYFQLSNTNVNTIGADGIGGNPGSFSWAANQAGYVAQIFNQGSDSNANGLTVKIASNIATALDISQGTQQLGVGTSLLVVKGNGNVGIGTINPRSKLDIGPINKGQLGAVFGRLAEGDTSDEGTFLGVRGYVTQIDKDFPVDRKSFAIEHSFYGQLNSSINFFRGINKTGGFITFNTNSNTEQIRIDPNGNVGIGTTSPNAKLHVAGFKSGNIASYRWFAYSNAGAWGDTSAAGAPISIMASDRVVASEFDATSDLRIKKDFVVDNSQQSLETLNQIQIKSFHYKDEIEHGRAWNKGVVAQELEAIFQEAVNTHTDFVPDIYSLPQSVTLSNNILAVTMESPHDLVTGDTIRLITATGMKEVQVVKTSDSSFSVNDWREETTDIFVYGKQVNDCRTVNYNSIFCLGISAIQELYKQLKQLKKEIETIKERIPALSPAISGVSL